MKIYDSGLHKTKYWGGRDGISFPFVNHDDIFDFQKLPVRPDVCLLQRVQGQRLQSWWGGNTKGELST